MICSKFYLASFLDLKVGPRVAKAMDYFGFNIVFRTYIVMVDSLKAEPFCNSSLCLSLFKQLTDLAYQNLDVGAMYGCQSCSWTSKLF